MNSAANGNAMNLSYQAHRDMYYVTRNTHRAIQRLAPGGSEKQVESVSRPMISSVLPFSSPSPSGTLAFLLPPICNKTCSQERLCSHSFRFLTGIWNKLPQNHIRNTVAREAEIMVSFIFKSEEHRWMKQTHWKFLSQAEKHMINNSEGK